MSDNGIKNKDLSSLSVFEPKVRRNVIDFCIDLNNTRAYIYVVMACKAAYLVPVFGKLSYISRYCHFRTGVGLLH